MTYHLALVCDECTTDEFVTLLQALPPDWIEVGNHHFCGEDCRSVHARKHAEMTVPVGGGTMQNHFHLSDTALDGLELDAIRGADADEEMAYHDALQRGYAMDRR